MDALSNFRPSRKKTGKYGTIYIYPIKSEETFLVKKVSKILKNSPHSSKLAFIGDFSNELSDQFCRFVQAYKDYYL
ncbi:MAG: hypothetical protein ACJAS1_004291 [Oleiphilaceae bacterium]